jgi:predicted acetyltransferase
MSSNLALIKPTREHLSAYLKALDKGWSELVHAPALQQSAHNRQQREQIHSHTDDFLELFDDPSAKAHPYLLPDRTVAYPIPSLRRWIWDTKRGEFCGNVSLRWLKDSTELPAHIMGHIGYAVPEWLQNQGFASFGLKAILTLAEQQQLPFVTLVTDQSNLASQRVIGKCGGVLIQEFKKPDMYGAQIALKFKIDL